MQKLTTRSGADVQTQVGEHHQLMHRLRTEPAMGHWDRRRLEQILTHLLRNALKFGNELPIEVAVTSTHDRARI